MAIVILLIAADIHDVRSMTSAGKDRVKFCGFSELAAVNPDIAAWIRLDNTGIDHPVVQGDDNYEYLGKDFYGCEYAGGTLFMDTCCRKDLSDSYIIIHGHHMLGGAMFGDLEKYTQKDFFEKNSGGELMTPECTYVLTVNGVATADAYDSDVYYTDSERQIPLELTDMCELSRKLDYKDGDKMIALSTCKGNMTNERIVVFCRARKGDRQR